VSSGTLNLAQPTSVCVRVDELMHSVVSDESPASAAATLLLVLVHSTFSAPLKSRPYGAIQIRWLFLALLQLRPVHRNNFSNCWSFGIFCFWEML